jgi:hypothetical protein
VTIIATGIAFAALMLAVDLPNEGAFAEDEPRLAARADRCDHGDGAGVTDLCLVQGRSDGGREAHHYVTTMRAEPWHDTTVLTRTKVVEPEGSPRP